LRAEIFGHVSGAIYVPEARVFGDVQQTLEYGTSLTGPGMASRKFGGASRLRFPDKPSIEGFRDRRAFTAGCGYAPLGPSTLNVARGEPRVIHFIAQEGC
jgi:hypothetical protein